MHIIQDAVWLFSTFCMQFMAASAEEQEESAALLVDTAVWIKENREKNVVFYELFSDVDGEPIDNVYVGTFLTYVEWRGTNPKGESHVVQSRPEIDRDGNE